MNILQNVSETALLTLYCRAYETESENPIIQEKKAIEIVKALEHDYDFSKFRRARNFKINAALISLRMKRFDIYVQQFLEKNPEGIIINLGCGLDTRFSRIDDGRMKWYDLDLPQVIEIRKNFFRETDRYHMISSSVLNYAWMAPLAQKNRPVLILAEGLLEYLHEDDVKQLVLKLQESFPGCELVCEVIKKVWARLMQKGGFYARAFQRKYHLDEGVIFKWGIDSSDELEQWNSGINFLDEWNYFDENEKKIGWMKIFGKIKLFRKSQWVIHYRLDRPGE